MPETLKETRAAFAGSRRRPGINVLRVASAVLALETLTFGQYVFEVDVVGNGPSVPGRIPVDLSASPTAAAATGSLTWSGTSTNDQTVTIGSRVYTFKTALTGAANEVLIGADQTASRNNLVAAINGAAGAGTTYGTGTVAHADVTAAPSSTNVLVVTAKLKGTAANSLATTETLTNAAWGGATLSGGVNPTAAEFTTALELAAEDAPNLQAKRVSANEVLFVNWSADTFGEALACSETLSGANNGWAAATTFAQAGEPEELPLLAIFSRSPTAQEITLGNVYLPLSFVPVDYVVQVRDSSGKLKAFDGAITQDGKILAIDLTGSVDLVATDKITVLATA